MLFLLICQGCSPIHESVVNIKFDTTMSNELTSFSKFSDREKENVAREVNDVAIGRYDGRIRKYLNKGEDEEIDDLSI